MIGQLYPSKKSDFSPGKCMSKSQTSDLFSFDTERSKVDIVQGSRP